MKDNLKSIGKAILEHTANRFFSLEEIVTLTGIDHVGSRRVMERLNREGIVRKIAHTLGEPTWKKGRPIYRITYRVANKKALAARIAPKLKEDTIADRMWKVIRYKRIFSRRDLRIVAGASYEHVKWYTKMLARAGFIKIWGREGKEVEWMLCRDCGAQRPYLGRRSDGSDR